MRLPAVIASVLLAFPAAAANVPVASGQVVGTDGKPIPGVELCTYEKGVRADCVTTDEKGFYRMERPVAPDLYIQTKGYAPRSVLAAPQIEPVVIERVASLLVRVVDAATGQPVPKGTVEVNLPSGKKLGSPVPFNRAGVRMSTMAPGETLVRVVAEGYEPGGPIIVDLVGGQEKELTVPLKKAANR